MRRLLVVGMACAIAGCIAAPAPAEARTFKTASSFGFFAGSPDAFLGQVSSSKQACRSARVVNVYRLRPGRDPRVGAARSGPTGQWTIERADVPAGRYYATIARKKIGRDKYCGAWRSSTLPFG